MQRNGDRLREIVGFWLKKRRLGESRYPGSNIVAGVTHQRADVKIPKDGDGVAPIVLSLIS